MKKRIALVLIGMISLSMLTGCGSKKTEEQKAKEEIRQHLQEEAASAGAEAALTEKSTDYSDVKAYNEKVASVIQNEGKMRTISAYTPDDDTLDEMNKMIIRNSEFGAASNSY